MVETSRMLELPSPRHLLSQMDSSVQRFPALFYTVLEVNSVFSVRAHKAVPVAEVSCSSGGGLPWCAGRGLHPISCMQATGAAAHQQKFCPNFLSGL